MKESTEVWEELSAMGSSLNVISRTMPFDLPSEYFNKLPNDISLHLNQNIGVHLPESKLPFSVPNQYFEHLPKQVLHKAKQSTLNKKISFYSFYLNRKIQLAAAAVIVLMLGSTLGISLLKSKSFEGQLDKIPVQTVQDYVLQTSPYLMSNSNGNTLNTLPNQLSKTEIKQYLDETGWQ
ncbi:MAG: hypothetical protein JST52_05660 [Bacteroidetes bacterium]|nr:hypothetical protein [Bacteroidota bacterium]MBS1740784.1 hypothetical protein [Bacteroidota bacterium]